VSIFFRLKKKDVLGPLTAIYSSEPQVSMPQEDIATHWALPPQVP